VKPSGPRLRSTPTTLALEEGRGKEEEEYHVKTFWRSKYTGETASFIEGLFVLLLRIPIWAFRICYSYRLSGFDVQ
jgi:hypothetical protein